MTEIKMPYTGRAEPTEYITLSSSGFPNPANVQVGTILTFIDTGQVPDWPLHTYVCYGGMWEPDPRNNSA